MPISRARPVTGRLCRLETFIPRAFCLRCRKAKVTCYCERLKPFASRPRFVILIHRNEHRRAIATGRMAHLSLTNSLLFEGTDFTHHDGVNAVLSDPKLHPVVLYPSKDSVPLGEYPFPPDREPVVFVVDGTWRTAVRMRRESTNLHGLPYVSLAPTDPSGFLVRKQPRPECLSTIEAIHAAIDTFATPGEPRPQRSLLEVFHWMVQSQYEFTPVASAIATRGVRKSRA